MSTVEEYWTGFGARVLAARLAAGLTQTELGDRIHRSRSSIANIEAGRQHVPIPAALDLAAALNITPAALVLAGSQLGPPAPNPAVRRRALRRHLTHLATVLTEAATELHALVRDLP